ncbi:hypothetical protein F66182_3146 [Fusarium sp. NRRL 66182]|nr:hypothetical protein F66182_3146 [Fusarium sp. NRRL 66182]
MEHDIIARLYPHNDSKKWASNAIEENPRHAPPLLQPVRDQPNSRRRRSRRERGSTEPPENPSASALNYLPSLVVRFGDAPRTNRGLIFGSNPKCDVVLDYQGVSNVHFSITFDDYNHPIVQDLGSLMGTQVTYNGDGEGARSDFRWIVGGHQIPEEKKNIVVTVPDAVAFQIVVQTHDIRSPAYVGKVARFKQGAATTEGILKDLGLSNPPTRPRTGTHSPGTGEINLKKKLGEGSFGVVLHLWNVSTGEERAMKTPSPRAIQNDQVDHGAWEREAYIMGLVEHPHIVRLIESFFDPQPELHLEYMPCGSLDDHNDISYYETLTIVHQCSSALAYLHGREVPIAHRDIKPANILVESRSTNHISVKLGDFGLSRHGFELITFCGTYLYLAPEVYSDMQGLAGYTAAVDVWSLGVVACQLIYGLPRYREEHRSNGVAWCRKIVEVLQRNVRRRPSALGSMLVNCMVVVSPESRYSASDCYDVLEDMIGKEQGSFHGLEPASYSEYALQKGDTQDLSTVVYQPRSTGAATPSYFVKSLAPPPESPSSSSGMAQQHEESEEPSSSAIRRYHNLREGHELDHFVQDYSADPFNSLYMGSSLASQLGRNNSEDWASQFLNGSSQQNQDRVGDSEIGRGLGPSGSSLPRGGNGGWDAAGGSDTAEGDNVIGAADYEEMAGAALLLQLIGQGSGAP